MTVRRGIFLRQKRAAESWFHFEQIEIIAANDQTKNVLRFPGPCHSHGAEGVGGHPGERTILFGVIEKIQIGARLHTREPGIGRECANETIGMARRQRTQKQSVNDAENSCVYADPERDGQKCDDRKPRGFNQHSNGVTQILPHHQTSEIRIFPFTARMVSFETGA